MNRKTVIGLAVTEATLNDGKIKSVKKMRVFEEGYEDSVKKNIVSNPY